MEDTRGENSVKRKPERFVCIWCAYMWTDSNYSDPEEFRAKYMKIRAKCPRCGIESEKPIDKNKI